MRRFLSFFPWLLYFSLTQPVPCFTWDTTDLELFDLVEEVQQNFYEFLGVEQEASSADIRKAYRKLSLTLHPDKNKEENAETEFRKLVAIYEVLKDEERRQRYHDILVNGLPDWRQPVFYYRRVRKMSNAELGLLLFIILTVGHYAVVWSIYLEKQLDELLSKKKREKKKKTGSKGTDEVKFSSVEKNERSVVRPQWYDLLPFKLGIWFYLTLKSLPQKFQDTKQFYKEYKEMKLKEEEAAKVQAELETLQKERKPKVKKPKSEYPVYMAAASEFLPSYDQSASIEEIEEQMDGWLEERDKSQKKKAPEWTEEDLSLLTRGMVKFPGGTPGRWEKIAHELGRSVADVTAKVKQVKDSVSSTPGTTRFSELKSVVQPFKGPKAGAILSDHIITKRDEEEDDVNYDQEQEEGDIAETHTEITAMEIRHRKRKMAKTPERTFMIKEEAEEKHRGKRQKDFDNVEQDDDSDDEKRKKAKGRPSEELLWSQNQQKLLELALQQYPKGTPERWDKIAKCVPGKCKEECMARYKLLAELVQKRKQGKS
ncbi:dnaJ homolog subfamily C member 1 [Latimeria chalumnae]|uniref:DnaJ homolog subfamily C member 1 n=1 Tax=Latimeria chalumnae TaxID=7897 RepID=H3AAL7_LATCH|nr:PREDICTED: dnaJ homolog subfamily C member 1 [Latimeria chalumnae]|eukprot:XP_006002456.1 PREDICTED: dnaJ homolog subfamily C member 1 [Latimeria chalumnae]